MRSSKSVEYIASYVIASSPGVSNKIRQTVDVLNANGYNARMTVVPWGGLRHVFQFVRHAQRSRARTMILRNQLLVPLLFPLLLWKRCLGTRILVDVPTPLGTTVHELKTSGMSPLALLVRLLFLHITFPLALYPANRVFQYANESRYFSLGLGKKTRLIANGIDVASIQARVEAPAWPAKTFVMVAVASLAEWHGFDRVIKGMAAYLESPRIANMQDVKLIIVGDGACRASWEKLALSAGVAHCVEFAGFRTGSELTGYFDQAHVAIASLGLFRIGLDMASVLKAREYTARGLPFVATGRDTDFEPPPAFVHKVRNIDEPVDIEGVINWYECIQGRHLSREMRRYAERRLDFKQKVLALVEQ